VDIRANGLDFLLYERAVHSNDTVSGWALFEIPEGHDSVKADQFRVHIKDTAGVEFTEEIASQNPDDDSLQGATLLPMGEVDISGCAVKYYSEVYPQK